MASGTGVLRRTEAAIRVAWNRTDSRAVFLVAGVAYLVLYLATVGDLSFASSTSGPFSVRTVDDVSRAFASRGFFRFDAIAILSIGPHPYLFSPLNVVVTVVLSSLVGANVALTYLGRVQPKACGLQASTGARAGFPALLSGAACCGPTILLVVGIQASATIVTGFQLLVPIAVTMLVGSLLSIGRHVDPTVR